jgi:hypothetical protein
MSMEQFDCRSDDLARCIREQFQEMDENGQKPGSEDWVQFDEDRKRLYESVRLKYLKVTGRKVSEFPFSESYIVKQFTRYRKLGALDEKQFVERFYGKDALALV